MYIKTHSKKAYVIVEAAIFLPIFIIALVTIGYVLRGIGMTETVMHCLSNQGRKLCVEGYIKNRNYDVLLKTENIPHSENLKKMTAEWVSQETLFWRVQHQLSEETGNWVQNLDLAQFKENYEQDGRNGLIKASFQYDIPIPVPTMFISRMNFQENIVVRSFIGRDSFGEARSFSDMERKQDEQTVYVFPRAGERYHNKNCRILRETAKKIILSTKGKKKYKPCKVCHPQSLPIGSMVYVFEQSGQVYHRGNCTSVDRFFVPMEKEEAERKGYTPCHICGGEAN